MPKERITRAFLIILESGLALAALILIYHIGAKAYIIDETEKRVETLETEHKTLSEKLMQKIEDIQFRVIRIEERQKKE